MTQSSKTTTEAPAWQAPHAFDAVAIAASAGGLQALSVLLGLLPAGFKACVVVVQHLDPKHPSLLAHILSQHTVLRVKQAEDGERALAGVVYIGPPDWHLLLTPAGTLALSQSERVNHVRPSADRLFMSLAQAYRERAIAVVLSGTGHDGSLGVREVRRMGGKVIAQDELSSAFFGMPGEAILTGCVDYVLTLGDIAPALVSLLATGDIQ